jgi:DNA-binding GntR family transcriptional regulator
VLGRRQFKEVMELRALLEGRATSLACEKINHDGFQPLQRHSKDLDEASKKQDIVARGPFDRNLGTGTRC